MASITSASLTAAAARALLPLRAGPPLLPRVKVVGNPLGEVNFIAEGRRPVFPAKVCRLVLRIVEAAKGPAAQLPAQKRPVHALHLKKVKFPHKRGSPEKRRNSLSGSVFAARRKRSGKGNFRVLEQVMGVEPTSSAWEADVLPMNYICKCTEIH